MSELEQNAEQTPTTGTENPCEKNGMGGISETPPEEPPKRKRGRPPKKPGDPPMTYSKKSSGEVKELVKEQKERQRKAMAETTTVGEYFAKHPSSMPKTFTNTMGRSLAYDPSLTADEVVARDIDRHMEIMALPRVDTNSLEELQGRYVEYMQICRKYGKRMTIAGFTEALGVSKSVLWKWANGSIRKSPEIVEFINAVFAAINAELEDLMVSGRINPVSGIFLLKQQGYRDTVDVAVSNSNVAEKTEEELTAEYLDSIPTVDE